MPDRRDEYSREREHIEKVIGDRFNFLIVFVGVVFAGLVASDSWPKRLVLGVIGLVVSFAMLIAIERAQTKFNLLFARIKAEFNCHPASEIDDAAGSSGSARWILGSGLPCFFAMCFLVAATVAATMMATHCEQSRAIKDSCPFCGCTPRTTTPSCVPSHSHPLREE